MDRFLQVRVHPHAVAVAEGIPQPRIVLMSLTVGLHVCMRGVQGEEDLLAHTSTLLRHRIYREQVCCCSDYSSSFLSTLTHHAAPILFLLMRSGGQVGQGGGEGLPPQPWSGVGAVMGRDRHGGRERQVKPILIATSSHSSSIHFTVPKHL